MAVVLDAYSRKVIGWQLGRNLDASLPLGALEAAIASRHPRPGLVHHSDRGTQYASKQYLERLENCGAHISMSRPARPWENGKCESFMNTLKREEIDARRYRGFDELQAHVEEFLEQIYNRVRLHRRGIPWQVALQQSLPPLSPPTRFCNNQDCPSSKPQRTVCVTFAAVSKRTAGHHQIRFGEAFIRMSEARLALRLSQIPNHRHECRCCRHECPRHIPCDCLYLIWPVELISISAGLMSDGMNDRSSKSLIGVRAVRIPA